MDTAYTVGVVPQFEPRRMFSIWSPLLKEISIRTGLHLLLVVPRTIPDFEAGFRQGKYDFAYMNPYHFTVARRTQGYEPVARDGSRKLYGIVVVRKDSRIRGAGELDGAQMAFPSPNALGATLLTRSELKSRYGVAVNPVWAQTHSSAYLNVVLGKVEAAGGVMATFRRQKPEIRSRLRVLYETRRVPPHPLAAHPRVRRPAREAVRRALIACAEAESCARVLARVPIKQPVQASAAEYAFLGALGLDRVNQPAP